MGDVYLALDLKFGFEKYMVRKKTKCVALFSGGLDSSLAVLLMLKQEIEVTALMFGHDFCAQHPGRPSSLKEPSQIAEKFGFKLEIMHLGNEFIELVQRPKYGYGKNMNPCIDCKILMLKKAKEFMMKIGADFLVTGEVVGQRPKSQFRTTLYMIAKQADVEGIVLRPLSAGLLKPTVPEEKGLVDRDKLLDINGRSRKVQMKLAEEYGLEYYPTPASGCLLTDPRFAKRLKDMVSHREKIDLNDIRLLKVGRHFRFDRDALIVVGRNEEENRRIEKLYRDDDILFEALGTGSPIVLLRGKASDDAVDFAARLTARYCDRKYEDEVEITLTSKAGQARMTVEPFDHEDVKRYQV